MRTKLLTLRNGITIERLRITEYGADDTKDVPTIIFLFSGDDVETILKETYSSKLERDEVLAFYDSICCEADPKLEEILTTKTGAEDVH